MNLYIIIVFSFLYSFSFGQSKPSWVSNRPTSDRYFIGIGFAEKDAGRNFREKAKADALNDLASEISVNVSSELIDIATEYSGFSKEYVRNEIKISTSKELEGHERVEDYEDKNRYWVYYRLSKEYFSKYADQAKIQYGNYLLMDKDDPVSQFELLIPCFVSTFKAIGQDIQYQDENRNVDLRIEVRSQIKSVLGNLNLVPQQRDFDAYYGKGLENPLFITVTNALSGDPIQTLPISFAFKVGDGSLSYSKLSTNRKGEVSTSVTVISDKRERQVVSATVNLIDFKTNLFKDQYVDKVLRGLSANIKSVDFTFNVSVLKKEIVGVIVVGSNLSKLLLEVLTKNFNTEYNRKTDFVIMDYRQAKEIIERENYDPTTCMGAECQVEIGKSLGVDKLIFIDLTYLQASGIIDVSTTLRNIGSLAIQESNTSRLTLKGSIDDFLLKQVPNLVDNFWKYINPAKITLRTNIPDVIVDIIPLNNPNVDVESRALNIYDEKLLPGLYRFNFEKIGYENKSFSINVEKGETYNRDITLNRKTRSKAFFKSLILPGSGQKYLADESHKGRNRSAYLFRLGILAGIAGTVVGWIDYTDTKSVYNEAQQLYLKQKLIEDITYHREIAEQKHVLMVDAENKAWIFTGITIGLWVWNTIDAVINFPEYESSYTAESMNLQLVMNESELGLYPALSLGFRF